MPKVLLGVRSQIMEAVRRQLVDGGYDALTLRSVAAECGISIGTIYNYFESKEALVSTFMTEEWVTALADVSLACIEAVSPRDAFQHLFDTLVEYYRKYGCVIQGFPAACYVLFSMRKTHEKMREQMIRLIKPVVERFSRINQPLLCEFLTDAVIVESQRGYPFSEFYSIISVYFTEPE